jgi:uncharacterized protein (TIGR02597 family)
MQPPPRRASIFGSLALAWWGWVVASCPAQQAFSRPSGYLRFDCPGGSDTVVSVPFHRTARWQGLLAAAPVDAGSGQTRLDLAGTPGFAAGSLLQPPHHVLTAGTSGAPGRVHVIVAHTDQSVTVVGMSPDDVLALEAGDSLRIVPAWTLDALFPPASQTTFHPSGGRLLNQRGSELLWFDAGSDGIGLAPARRFFVTGEGWIEAGTYAAAGSTVIAPGQPFWVRHPAGSAATTFFAHQEVFGEAFAVHVRVRQSGPQDTVLALPRPVPVTLAALAIPGSIFEDSPDTAPGNRRDELHVFDAQSPGFHKPPAAVYFRVAGTWHRDTDGFPAADGDLVEPSQGLLLRKAAGTGDETLVWVNEPTYDVTAP